MIISKTRIRQTGKRLCPPLGAAMKRQILSLNTQQVHFFNGQSNHVADFGGVLTHTSKDKLNMTAVEFHKLCFHKLCRVIVPGDTDSLSAGADRFKDKGHNLVQAFFFKVSVLDEMLILDIVLDNFLIYSVCVCRFLSLPFRRLCRVL